MEEENKKEKRGISALRTFKTDKTEYVKKENISAIDIAARQARAGIRLADRTPPKRYVLPLAIILALTFSLIGVAWFILFKKSSEPPIQPGLPKSILVSEVNREVEIDLGLGDQSDDIKSEVYFLDRVAENKLINIQFVAFEDNIKRLLTPKEFFDAIGVVPPSEFIESLGEEYMLAKFRNEDNMPVLIFELDSFEKAFAAMIAWERDNKIVNDFRKIFNIDNISSETSFVDKELKNKDVRLLLDSEDNFVFGYSLISQRYLVISTTQEMLEEVFRRFSLPQYIN